MFLEVLRGADDDEAERIRQPHADHVALDELAQANTGVKPFHDDVDPPIVEDELELDARVTLTELGKNGLNTSSKPARGTVRRKRPATSPGCAATSTSAARTCATPGQLHGGPAPVRRFLPRLIELVWNRNVDPGKVFDLTLPLDQVAAGYRAMDERRAIKTLLVP